MHFEITIDGITYTQMMFYINLEMRKMLMEQIFNVLALYQVIGR
jgi:hypothetical protein